MRHGHRLRVRSSDRSDPWLVGAVVVLVLAGLLFVFDTTYFFSQNRFGNSYRMVMKHGISVLIGVAVMWLLSRTRSDLLEHWSRPLMLVATLLLVVPLV